MNFSSLPDEVTEEVRKDAQQLSCKTVRLREREKREKKLSMFRQFLREILWCR